jgi:hypothetical protein
MTAPDPFALGGRQDDALPALLAEHDRIWDQFLAASLALKRKLDFLMKWAGTAWRLEETYSAARIAPGRAAGVRTAAMIRSGSSSGSGIAIFSRCGQSLQPRLPAERALGTGVDASSRPTEIGRSPC